MRPLRIRLQQVWRDLDLQSYVIERDYLLSWVLAGISAVPELGETLVFQGRNGAQEVLLRRLPFLGGPGLLWIGGCSNGG